MASIHGVRRDYADGFTDALAEKVDGDGVVKPLRWRRPKDDHSQPTHDLGREMRKAQVRNRMTWAFLLSG
jgi:hypothetical protein